MPVLISNANFMPTNFAEARLIGPDATPLLTVQKLGDLAARTAADGVEFTPVRSPAWTQLRRGHATPTPDMASPVKTLHGSFNGLAEETPSPLAGIPREDLLVEPLRSGSPLIRAAVNVLMPDGERSLGDLEGVAALLGSVTCVEYPHPSGDPEADRAQAARFPGKALIQYTPDVAGLWAINPKDPDAARWLALNLKLRGYRAVLPSFHGGRLGKRVRLRLNEHDITEQFLREGLVGEVHGELARIDFKDVDPTRTETSIKEATALMEEKPLHGLPLGRTFELLHEAGWQGNFVTEATIGGIATALSRLGHQPTRSNLFAAYRNINMRIAAELPQPAAP